MEFNRKELISVLDKVRPGLASKEIIENTNCFAFTGKRVCTYNDDIAVSHPLETDFKAIVEAKTFYSYLNKLKGEKVDISLVESGLEIKEKKTKAIYPVRENNDLDIYKMVIAKAKDHQKLSDKFVEGLKLCIPAVSKDASKPTLTTIHVFKTRMQATDSFRISFYKTTNPIEFLLPSNAAEALIQYKPVSVSLLPGWVSFIDDNGSEFCSRVLEGEVPDLTKFFKIPKKAEVSFTSSLIEALEKAILFVSDSTSLQKRVELLFTEKSIKLKAESEVLKGAKFMEIVPCKTGLSGEEQFTIRANPEHLINIINKTKVGYVSEDGNCLVFKDTGFLHVMAIG